MDGGGWLGRALEDYRVLLLDQRGTARSTPVTARTLARCGAPAEQAAHLAFFRSDAIVRDCEAVRATLIGDERWSVLGQSYGGFCATRYLSAAPEGLRDVFITGGLPGLTASADDVYRATYPLCAAKNRAYYARYPDDVERVQAIVTRLVEDELMLPCGDRLTPRRFQLLGLLLGFSDGFETLHYLLEEAFERGADGHLTLAFLRHFENALAYDTNPIFSVLHEACYTQGSASRWAAHRLRPAHPEFTLRPGEPVFFTGEMIYPWMFEELGALRPFREAAELVAETSDWPVLYDPEALARNAVPVQAAVYHDDMYVPTELSLETARRVPRVRPWITNEYEHNGLRADGARVLGRLIDMARGRA
jgi:pimeloyl-ACP methyl ester carboxylesterase